MFVTVNAVVSVETQSRVSFYLFSRYFLFSFLTPILDITSFFQFFRLIIYLFILFFSLFQMIVKKIEIIMVIVQSIETMNIGLMHL